MKFAAIYRTPEGGLVRYDVGTTSPAPACSAEQYWRAWRRPQEEIRGLTLLLLVRLHGPLGAPEVIIDGAWIDDPIAIPKIALE